MQFPEEIWLQIAEQYLEYADIVQLSETLKTVPYSTEFYEDLRWIGRVKRSLFIYGCHFVYQLISEKRPINRIKSVLGKLSEDQKMHLCRFLCIENLPYDFNDGCIDLYISGEVLDDLINKCGLPAKYLECSIRRLALKGIPIDDLLQICGDKIDKSFAEHVKRPVEELEQEACLALMDRMEVWIKEKDRDYVEECKEIQVLLRFLPTKDWRGWKKEIRRNPFDAMFDLASQNDDVELATFILDYGISEWLIIGSRSLEMQQLLLSYGIDICRLHKFGITERKNLWIDYGAIQRSFFMKPILADFSPHLMRRLIANDALSFMRSNDAIHLLLKAVARLSLNPNAAEFCRLLLPNLSRCMRCSVYLRGYALPTARSILRSFHEIQELFDKYLTVDFSSENHYCTDPVSNRGRFDWKAN